jgi:hypothetical protein
MRRKNEMARVRLVCLTIVTCITLIVDGVVNVASPDANFGWDATAAATVGLFFIWLILGATSDSARKAESSGKPGQQL